MYCSRIVVLIARRCRCKCPGQRGKMPAYNSQAGTGQPETAGATGQLWQGRDNQPARASTNASLGQQRPAGHQTPVDGGQAAEGSLGQPRPAGHKGCSRGGLRQHGLRELDRGHRSVFFVLEGLWRGCPPQPAASVPGPATIKYVTVARVRRPLASPVSVARSRWRSVKTPPVNALKNTAR